MKTKVQTGKLMIDKIQKTKKGSVRIEIKGGKTEEEHSKQNWKTQ